MSPCAMRVDELIVNVDNLNLRMRMTDLFADVQAQPFFRHNPISASSCGFRPKLGLQVQAEKSEMYCSLSICLMIWVCLNDLVMIMFLL